MDKLCYLCDMIRTAGGAGESVVARIRLSWKRFRIIMSILTCKGFLFTQRLEFTRHILGVSFCVVVKEVD